MNSGQATEQPLSRVRQFVRRHPWVMALPGLFLTAPAAYAVLWMLWLWALIFPFFLIPLLVLGPLWFGLVGGWRRRSYPRLWFGAGYLVGGLLIAFRPDDFFALVEWCSEARRPFRCVRG